MTIGTYVTPAGLAIPSLTQIRDDIAADQRATIDPNLDTSADSPQGQVNGVMANAFRLLWEALVPAFGSNDPDAAEGIFLDQLMAVTGSTRTPAAPSTLKGAFQAVVNLNPNTVLLAGRGAAVLGNPTASFHTIADFTAPNVGGAADYLIDMESDVTGPVVANSGTLTVITTPVVGWNSVNNPFDAVLGTLQDNDPQARVVRETDLRSSGNATVDAIRARLLGITLPDGNKPVTQSFVFQNESEVVDGNGLPGHSLLCILYDGISAVVPNDTVAQTLWKSKPAGVHMIGNASGTAIDFLGEDQTVFFSRPSITRITFDCVLTLSNSNQVPSQYLSIVVATLQREFLIKVRMGGVIWVRHYEGIITDIPGIDDCVITLGRFAFPPLSPQTNLQLTSFEMGDLQSGDITVS